MIFDEAYERIDFIKALQTKIFPGFVVDTRPLACSRKTKFVDGGVIQIGVMQFADGVEVPVRELEQQSSNDPRISVTKDAFKLLHDHQKDNALIVFWNKESSSWRISLLTSTYEGRSKTNSNPKRYSFLLGVGEKTKTPQKYLIDKGPLKDLGDLIARFDVEVVRKEFFKLYINLFLELYSTIKGNPTFQVLIDHKKIEPVSFAKNLMGKMIFLYFIQKKGWLGIEDKTKAFGTGDRDFFKKNFDRLAHDADLFQKHTNFYNSFLEPLFYSGLNKKNVDDRHPTLSMKVPYLNGGLFEEEYDRKHTIINLDNTVFKNIITSFNTYNFTIDEDDAHDREIAVDPEMLGKIFESMISVSKDNIDEILDVYHKAKTKKNISHPSPETILSIDIGKEINKKFGAFYTPREIVNYMTKESLIAHVVTKLHENNADVAQSDLDVLIRKLFDYKEKHLSKSEIEADKADGYELLKRYVFDIQESLKTLKILDPAVGSGAFPMGILQEVLGLRRYLIDTFDLKQESDFAIKKQIIQDTIYGVDIDPGAIDIARLRFWLSLIVDADEPVPLPNLDFKFVCANTLIPLEKNDSLFTASDLIMDLKALRLQYFASTSTEGKEELKRKFKSLQMALSGFGQKAKHDMTPKEWKKYVEDLVKQNTDAKNRQVMERDPFDSSKSNAWFDSAMMFGVDRFDIVIGNPPYLEFEELRQKDPYFEFYKTYYGVNYKFNLYCMFTLLNQFLLSKKGVLSYIIPNSFSKEKYNQKTREDYVFNRTIVKIVDFSQDPNVFEDASNDGYIVYLIKNSYKIDNYIEIDLYNNKQFHALGNISQMEFENSLQNQIVLPKGDFGIMSKIRSNSFPLGDVCFSRQGLGISKLYKEMYVGKINSNNSTAPLISSNKEGYGIPMKYISIKNNDFLFWDPKVLVDDKVHPGFLGDYEGEKIVIKNRGQEIVATYSDQLLFFNYLYNGIKLKYQIAPERLKGISNEDLIKSQNYKIKYILGIVNCSITKYYLKVQFSFRDLWTPIINLIPIPTIDENKQNIFVDLVDQILSKKKEKPDIDTSQLEKKIDQMVYELYGLTEEEIEVVEGSMGK